MCKELLSASYLLLCTCCLFCKMEIIIVPIFNVVFNVGQNFKMQIPGLTNRIPNSLGLG